MKEIEAEKITTKKLEVREEFELRDKNTGEIYCVHIENGGITNTVGQCGS